MATNTNNEQHDSLHILNSGTDMLGSSPPPTKRVKLVSRYNRLVNVKSSFPPLTVTEKPNLVLLKMMMDMNRDDVVVSKNYNDLDSYYNRMFRSRGNREVVFQQKDLSEWFDEGYTGSTMIGRSYAQSSLNTLPRKVLNTLYKGTHLELDMKCSYPTMLYVLYDHLDIPFVKRYITDRDSIMRGYMRSGIIEKDIKTMLHGTICSYPKLVYNYGSCDLDSMRTFSEHPFTSDLRKDLRMISDDMIEGYPEFYNAMVNRATANGKMETVLGTSLSYQAADMEHCVMRTVIDRIFRGDNDDLVFMADGVLVPLQKLQGESPELFCRAIESHVQDEMGFGVRFGIKDLCSNSFPICIPQSELIDSPYKIWKNEFEERFFALGEPPIFCRICPDGHIQDLNATDFNHVTMEQPRDFMAEWKLDKSKRMYERKDCYPPPLLCPENVFNTFAGIAAASLNPVADGYDIKPYLDHVLLLMGGHQESADYFNKLMANKVQNPGLKNRVMTFIRSTQGAGKGVLYSFLRSIFGSVNCASVPQFGDVLGKSTSLMESKLLLIVDELNGKDWKGNAEFIKNLITEDTMIFRKKYVADSTMRNSIEVIAFSNNWGAVDMSSGDRRVFAVTASGDYANKASYFDPLIEWMGKDASVRAVYDWFISMDLSKFNPSEDRVITETTKEIMDQSKTIYDMVLQSNIQDWFDIGKRSSNMDIRVVDDGVIRIKTSLVIDSFQAILTDFKIAAAESRHKTVSFMTKQFGECQANMDKFKNGRAFSMRKARSHGVNYYLMDVEVIKRYIQQFETVDDMEDEEA